MVRQLGDLKKISGQPVHQLAGTVLVKEVKVQLLKVHVKIPPDICFHANTELMSPVGDDEIHDCPHQKHRHNDCHDSKKRLIQLVRQQIVHDVARYQRKRDVNRAHDKCTAHIQQKELFVRGEIG